MIFLLDECMLGLFPWPGTGRVITSSSLNSICLLVQPALFLSPASATSARLLSGLFLLLLGCGLVRLLLILLSATGTRLGSTSAALGAACTLLTAASAALALLGAGQTGA